MRFIMFTILTCAVMAHADDTTTDIDLTPNKPFTLSIEHWHSMTGDRLKQTVDVSEGDSFRVVTTVNGIRWTTKGVVGKVSGDTIPVELTTEWFKDQRSNERGKTRFDLKLTGEKARGRGAVHGVFITPSIKRNKLR